ncbi:AAA family ATPase [Enterovirga rhinocerotis]|uniref:MoxR-like ATPase n=1 Tax=Enterovirga rhinocerotis TaxID=1339210 RepID=A0A4R7BJE3_9HYPH|nr:MoxR family ATPase [Enterovirga rhinocerotis]TDR85281.1 MoxR-like ATPase [Enterovirga rhinocerotis]
MELRDVSTITEGIRGEIGKAVIGQDEVVELMLVSLLCGGHVLLEGVPGTAKTLLAQSFAASLSLRFGRIQFTPDMMPGDLLGTNLFDFRTSSFNLTQGPIFTDLLLADEINRTPPKTQAALLQAMNERNVTIDGVTHPLGEAFMVVATQNPIEQQGTYPLPEAQLDRFLFKVNLSYPSREEEYDIVARHGHRAAMPKLAEFGLSPIVSEERLLAIRGLVGRINLGAPLVGYIVDLVRSTRSHPAIETGASPRAATMLASASRARAAVQGRDFVIPDDVKDIALPLLRHRIVLAPNAEIDGLDSDKVVAELIEQVAVPR